MTTADEQIILEREGFIATLIINRPDKLNTITKPMAARLHQLCYEVNQDDSIRALVVRSTGDRAFSAGSDVSTLDEYGTNWQMRNRPTDYIMDLFRVRKPAVAAVRGYALGGGLEIACACDIRVATHSAKFGASEIKMGWHAGAGETQFLTRLLGYGNAAELLMTGDMIDAAEAYRIGLIQKLVDDDQLESTAYSIAERIARNAPIAVQSTKNMMRVALSTPLDIALTYENDMFSYCMLTRDAAEGRAAFLEKREPQFRGE